MSGAAEDLRTNYAPVEAETTGVEVEIEVHGSLPGGLAGTYVRNGPNRTPSQGVGGLWFDGQGMLHAVRIEERRATYSNRWVRTPSLDQLLPAFGRAEESASAGLADLGADGLLALSDTGRPWRLDPATLDTVGPDVVEAPGVSMVLPHVTRVDGRPVTVGTSWADPTLTFLERGDDGRWRATGEHVAERRPFLHDLRVVDGRVVTLDLPWRREERGVGWDPEAGAAIVLADRVGSGAVVAEVTPAYVSHLATAWSEGATVHVVGCRRRVPGVDPDEDNPFDDSPGSLRRWSIDARSGRVAEADLDDQPCDFPSLLPGGKRVVVTRPTGRNFTVARGVSVIDMETGAHQDHHFGPGRFGGEMISLGDVDGQSLVAGFVHDASRNAAELLVLDAGDLGGGPLARLRLPVRVPFGLHGTWLPAGGRRRPPLP
jgi:carotenoid cleavage dioxygenase-like enzyme